MFSFRTTPLDQQPDIVLAKGRVGVLCNQVAWNPEKGEYLFETLYRKGNLKKVFVPSEELAGYTPLNLEGCEFFPMESMVENLSDIDAIIVELQEIGARYSPIIDLMAALFTAIHHNGLEISV